jgi:uncharacterized membrane protein
MQSRDSRFKKFFLISLVLNVFLLGALAGGLYRWLSKDSTDVEANQRNVLSAVKQLPKDSGHRLREMLVQARRSNAAQIFSVHEARHTVLKTLSEPQLDRTALDAALASTREADMALRSKVEGTVADFAMTLTPEERLKLVEGLRRHGPLRLNNTTQP